MKDLNNKKVLIVGVGKICLSFINFFNKYNCNIKVTDIKPIFDLNKIVKKLKRIEPQPIMVFGEHREEDFLEADIIIYHSSVNPNLPQLEIARKANKEVYSEFAFSNTLCDKPIIAVCGTYGRTIISHMIGFILRIEGKNVFVGGTDDNPFIEYAMIEDKDSIDYVIVEVSVLQTRDLKDFYPIIIVFSSIGLYYSGKHFSSPTDYIETKLSVVNYLAKRGSLVVNYDKLSNNNFLRDLGDRTYWYSRKSFVNMGVLGKVDGTYFHNRRIHSNINYHSEFKVNKMRIVGRDNRENLLAAITVCKILNMSDESIQTCVEKFPGIPHRMEFLVKKNGVYFYNDSKSEDMENLVKSVSSFKEPVILIVGGKDVEGVNYDLYINDIIKGSRVLILVGESKERMNRALQSHPQVYLVGSFEESILFAYQKSRTGDIILFSPGNPSTDFFRDYGERGNYFKKLVYQL